MRELNISKEALEILYQGSYLTPNLTEINVSKTALEVLYKIYGSPLLRAISTSKQSLEVLTNYTPEEATPTYTHYIAGHIYENMAPCIRTVRLYDEATGLFYNSAVSLPDGSYTINTVSGTYFAVCIDNAIGLNYNDLVIRGLVPLEL